MTEMIVYNVWRNTKYEPLYLECEMEYSAPERGSREYGTGIQLEPDIPEDIVVLRAMCGEVDILDVLREDVVEDIIKYYAEELEERKYDYFE